MGRWHNPPTAPLFENCAAERRPDFRLSGSSPLRSLRLTGKTPEEKAGPCQQLSQPALRTTVGKAIAHGLFELPIAA